MRASMAQVAAACGISKANIYHYYSSKDRLVFDILDSYLSDLRDRLAALDKQPNAAQPQEQLLSYVTEVLLAYEGMDAEHQIQTEGIAMLTDAQQKILKDYQRDIVRQLSAILASCAPDAFNTDAAKLNATTMSVFGMLNWYYMWHPNADNAARRDYAKLISDLVLKGIG